MYTPGTLLRLAREDRKLSLADTKSIVKIRETALYAMETDQFDKFPAQYMQTFLPEYADFLGVSPKKLAEAFTVTLPEYEYLAQHLYARSLQHFPHEKANNKANEKVNTPLRNAARFVRSNARKGVVVVLACCLAWFVVGSELSVIGTMFTNAVANTFAKAIVVTPEDMRGTPFTELNMPAHPEKRFSSIDVNTTTSEEGQAKAMQSDADDVNNSMKVIRLASVIPLQAEMRTALTEGFEYMMKDDKAEARKRISTPLASVSLAAAKAKLEAESNETSNETSNKTSNEMFFTPDMEESESTRPEERVVTSEAAIETISKNADAASARIALMAQTRITQTRIAQTRIAQTRIAQTRIAQTELHTPRIIASIKRVELQQPTMTYIAGLDAPQAFSPVQMPPELTNGYVYLLQADTMEH
jgi:Helix-turn-helix domain